jgi:general secretion pathway protein A
VHTEFYKLKQDPFRLTPDPAFICMTVQHREAFSGLVYSACTRPGLTVLVGEAGTGKTTLLYMLLGLLEKRGCATAMVTHPTLSRDEFLDFALARFGVACPSPLRSRQLIALEEALLRNRREGRPSILIVDEAQRLSPEVLEEIRLLLNLETPQQKLLDIVVAGQPELTDVLRRPEFRQLKQRVSSFCKLEPLNRGELRDYLNHRLARAGLPDQKLFPESSIDLVYEYTRGIPRLVNTLCNSSLQTGFALQSPSITASIVREAARDLDLLPPLSPLAASSNGHDRLPPAAAALLETPPQPAPEPGAAVRVPLESYSNSQASLGFFADLMSRWR